MVLSPFSPLLFPYFYSLWFSKSISNLMCCIMMMPYRHNVYNFYIWSSGIYVNIYIMCFNKWKWERRRQYVFMQTLNLTLCQQITLSKFDLCHTFYSLISKLLIFKRYSIFMNLLVLRIDLFLPTPFSIYFLNVFAGFIQKYSLVVTRGC